jgi:hypothetical protein
MSTHYVNQELAKHRYATLLREGATERLIQEPARAARLQLTWSRRRLRRVYRPTLRLA